ncbi:hypothetical protein Tco_0570237 [Tanacetum coccineum]
MERNEIPKSQTLGTVAHTQALNLNLIRTSESEYSIEKSESDFHLNLNKGLFTKVNRARGAKIHWGSLLCLLHSSRGYLHFHLILNTEPAGVFWGCARRRYLTEAPRSQGHRPVPQDKDEREPMFIQTHDPDYVPEPVYPEYIPLEDEHVFPAEEQPLPPVNSPTAESPGYVAESDPEKDLEEYENDETEDGPVDYPMDGGDDGDDDDGDSSRDDANDEVEEKHLASADSAIVVPTVEPVSPPEGIEPVIDPPLHRLFVPQEL